MGDSLNTIDQTFVRPLSDPGKPTGSTDVSVLKQRLEWKIRSFGQYASGNNNSNNYTIDHQGDGSRGHQ